MNFDLYLVTDVCCFREIIRISEYYPVLKGPLEEFGIYAPLQAKTHPSNRPTDSYGTLSCIYGVLEACIASICLTIVLLFLYILVLCGLPLWY